jgi:hypothetical protein
MSTGIVPAACAPSASTGTPRPESSRIGSTAPVSHETCERAISFVRGLSSASSAASASRAGRSRIAAARIVAPEATSPPKRPGCSESVVTTSSPGPMPRPETTTLQPSVVEAVSATHSAGAPTSAARRARSSSRSAMTRSK